MMMELNMSSRPQNAIGSYLGAYTSFVRKLDVRLTHLLQRRLYASARSRTSP